MSNLSSLSLPIAGTSSSLFAWPQVAVPHGHKFINIAAGATTVVAIGYGVLHSIVVNSTAAGAITIYDNTAASGTKVATLKASIVEGTYTFDVEFRTGLTIVTAAASDITVIYR